MNLSTIGNIPSSNLKHIKGQYLAAVAGVALAVSAVVAFGSTSTTTKPSAPSGTAPIAVSAGGSASPGHLFIIAASPAQQTEMEAANSDIRSSNPDRNDITVLLAGSPEAKAFVNEGVQELIEAGRIFSVVDMTTSSSAIKPQSQHQATESAQLAAERAAFTTLLEQIMLAS